MYRVGVTSVENLTQGISLLVTLSSSVPDQDIGVLTKELLSPLKLSCPLQTSLQYSINDPAQAKGFAVMNRTQYYISLIYSIFTASLEPIQRRQNLRQVSG